MRYVGQILRDTVGDAGSAFRFGGEEFTVLLPDQDEEGGAVHAEAIRQKVDSTTLSFAGQMIGTVSVSIGLAASPAEAAMRLSL